MISQCVDRFLVQRSVGQNSAKRHPEPAEPGIWATVARIRIGWTFAGGLISLLLIAGCAQGNINPFPPPKTPTVIPPIARSTVIGSPIPATPLPSATPSVLPSPTEKLATPTQAPRPTTTPAPISSGPEPTGLGVLQIPLRLRIPKIGVNATVETVGQTTSGAMDIPVDANDVAWYGIGPLPGEAGASVIAGHVDSKRGPAVFWSLQKLQVGDTVDVDQAGGTTRQFVVNSVQWYATDAAPLSTIFSLDGSPRLNLITCGGIFDRNQHMYDKRVVIYTHLAATSGQTSAFTSTIGGWMSAQALQLGSVEHGDSSGKCATSLGNCQ